MRPRNSCQEKCCQISRTQEQIKPVKEKLSRKTCSSYRRASELDKKLVKENLLVCAGLKLRHVLAGKIAFCIGLVLFCIAHPCLPAKT